MKKTTKKPVHPADRKLTKKERAQLEPLYLNYTPVAKPLSPEDRAKAYKEIDELFA